MSSALFEPTFNPIRASQHGDGPIWEQSDAAQARLALVIPTLREAENIGALLDRVRAALDPLSVAYEILVVDDDSRDGTAEIVSASAIRDPRIRLLVRTGERGLSGAILYGWQQTDADVLAVMDADHQHPPELLPQLFRAMQQERDLAIGSRYTCGGNLGRWRLTRRLVSVCAIWLTRPLRKVRLRASDPMSGFFMVRRQCLNEIRFQRSGFKLLLEILMRGRIRSVAEIPFEFGMRYRGVSKANLKVAGDYLRLLIRLYIDSLGLQIKPDDRTIALISDQRACELGASTAGSRHTA